MPVHQGVWGIDVGQSALKALRLEVIDGIVTATAFDYVEHPKILSQPDADPDQLTRESLEKFISRNKIKGDLIAISVPGQSGLARFVKLPPVEEKKIGDIVRFEAKQQIPFPLEEVVWDYQKIGSGEVTDGFAMETEIGLFAMKRDQIARSMQHFQDVNIEVHVIQMAPLALCNYVAYDLLNKGGGKTAADDADEGGRGKKRCAVALDIGTDSSNLVVTDGEKIIWQRPIPLGGNHLTRALSKELKLTFAKAEHLKKNSAKSPPELKSILTALKPVLSDFVSEVQRSLGFFTNSHRDAQIQYMVGLGNAFRLPGFQKYLSEKLQLEVRKPAHFDRLAGDVVVNDPIFTENILSYPVAYGLALQGLGQAKLRTNLLPQEIQFERQIRAKKPWAIAAASALFLGASVLTAGYAINYSAVSAKPIEAAITRASGALTKVSSQNSNAQTKEGEVKKLADEVKGVIAGKDEQLDWILLNQFINESLPRPDGSNLTLPEQRKYWMTQEAKEAAREYLDRIRGGQSADQPLPEDVRENLVLMDIEAVDSLYTENLKAAFDKAKEITTRNNDPLAGMCRYDQENPPKEAPPEGAGFIIEIRGSTYQKEGRQFIIDTLVKNLAINGRKNLPLNPAQGSAPPADAAPAAPTAPVAAPGAAAPAEAPKPASGNPMDNVIKDRATHVFLFNYWIDQDPRPGTFKYIQSPHIRELLAPASGATGGPPGAPSGVPMNRNEEGGGGAMGGSSRDTWAPLTSAGTTGGPTGVSGDDSYGGARGPGRGPALGMGRPTGAPTGVPTGAEGAPVSVGGTDTAAVPGAKKPKPRYEFVIMFFWREPTPSDALMKLGDPATPSSSPTGVPTGGV